MRFVRAVDCRTAPSLHTKTLTLPPRTSLLLSCPLGAAHVSRWISTRYCHPPTRLESSLHHRRNPRLENRGNQSPPKSTPPRLLHMPPRQLRRQCLLTLPFCKLIILRHPCRHPLQQVLPLIYAGTRPTHHQPMASEPLGSRQLPAWIL